VVTSEKEKKPDAEEEGEGFFTSSLLKADGFDCCVMGLGRLANTWTIVYDEDKVIGVLCDRDKMTLDEAREYFEFNIAGAYVGEGTPTFVRIMGLDRIVDETSE